MLEIFEKEKVAPALQPTNLFFLHNSNTYTMNREGSSTHSLHEIFGFRP